MTSGKRTARRTFAQKLESYFGGGQCFLLSKGRVALYVGLRALELPRHSKVLLPGYTCMVVPAAVQYAGLVPQYIDIDPSTYNIDMAALDAAQTENVSAIIVQHTYGIAANTPAIGPWAAKRGIPLIEDCCHTFGTRVERKLCGTLGAFSFMSGQWNKPFSTGLGGMLLVNEAAIADRAEQIVRSEALEPGAFKSLLLRLQILAFQSLARPERMASMTNLYRALNRWGLVIGSSSPKELRGEIPTGYLGAMAPCQARQGMRELARIDANLEHRRQLTTYYHNELPRIGFASVGGLPKDGAPLLRYPVRVANKSELLQLAARQGFELGSWFEVPLHPAGTRMEDLGYRDGQCPEAEKASETVVNLPTHSRITQASAEQTLRFLRKHARLS